jgi:hypothetical protein
MSRATPQECVRGQRLPPSRARAPRTSRGRCLACCQVAFDDIGRSSDAVGRDTENAVCGRPPDTLDWVIVSPAVRTRMRSVADALARAPASPGSTAGGLDRAGPTPCAPRRRRAGVTADHFDSGLPPAPCQRVRRPVRQDIDRPARGDIDHKCDPRPSANRQHSAHTAPPVRARPCGESTAPTSGMTAAASRTPARPPNSSATDCNASVNPSMIATRTRSAAGRSSHSWRNLTMTPRGGMRPPPNAAGRRCVRPQPERPEFGADSGQRSAAQS